MAKVTFAFAAFILIAAPVPANPSTRHSLAPTHAPTAGALKTANAMPDVAPDTLWDAQQGLVQKMLAALQPRIAGRSNVYAVAVAASGRQQLFSREAHLALQVASARFGAGYRGGLLLSNGAPDILSAPLATRGNTVLAMDGLAHRANPAEDIAFVYLASHGAPDASLETDLPNQQGFSPISAKSIAEALTLSGIRHRIFIISACFSGSWISALANDDTIIVTAAQSDRTSFGCDDRRRLTYFGEAFLEGPLAHGGSLQEAYETARRTVARWEAAQKVLPSEPQAFVGRNMQAVWAQRGAPGK